MGRLACLVSLALLSANAASCGVASPNTTTGRLAAGLPTVTLDNATVVGVQNGSTAFFLGIPFARAPRLRLPERVPPYTGTVLATAFGNQCIQQTVLPPSLPPDAPPTVPFYFGIFLAPAPVPEDEDCLNLNVIVPAGTASTDKLPVVVWIFGGGFQIGSNAIDPGEAVVARSIEIGQPIIYVAINYRLSAFGFLGGQEVKEAGVANLGLHDQREGLRWVQKYISSFGGDPEKVMIWGESAGAMSVALHMLWNNGNTEGLFRAAFMESGNAPPTGYVDNEYLQRTYDAIVADTGCSDASDTLECLRGVPTDVFKFAMDKTPTFFGYQQTNTPWFPRADGTFLAEPPERQLLNGKIARVPFVTGNDEDEGTAFAFATLNITTDDAFLGYLQRYYYPNIPKAAVAKILDLYPSDPASGSPYNTGDAFAYSPQYKRMASFQGDFIEQAPRRLFVQQLSDKQPVYAFLSKVNELEGVGAAHGTELPAFFGGGNLTDYVIRFAATLDPNGDGAFFWPQYTNERPQLLTCADEEPVFSVTSDTYRVPQMEYLTALSLADPM